MVQIPSDDSLYHGIWDVSIHYYHHIQAKDRYLEENPRPHSGIVPIMYQITYINHYPANVENILSS